MEFAEQNRAKAFQRALDHTGESLDEVLIDHDLDRSFLMSLKQELSDVSMDDISIRREALRLRKRGDLRSGRKKGGNN